MQTFIRPFVIQLEERLSEPVPRIQVLVGPRQVGKTTGVRQLLERSSLPWHYANADDLLAVDRTWLLQQWQQARLLGPSALLIIDEIQKVPNWSETIKGLWDKPGHTMRLVVLGSSSLQLQKGLTESLAGRFELIRVYHWTLPELCQAFNYSFEQYLSYGGYPGAVRYEPDFERWYAYLKDSIIESVIGKDILLNHRVANPALFRQAFEIICRYPAQEISYTKLLGQLQDKGNTDLVKYYLELYSGAFLVQSLAKFSTREHLTRSSSPKILLACPALYTMHYGPDAVKNSEVRGRLFELAVGAHLHQLPGTLTYWRNGNQEVDFIYSHRNRIYAIEVKSGRRPRASGLEAFLKQHPAAVPLVITPENVESFCNNPSLFLRMLS